MKLTVLRAKSYHAASAALIEKLKQVDPCRLDEPHIVISNVKTSMSGELQILDALGGSFNTRVTTFSRLTSMLLPDKKFISKQSAVVILTKITAELKNRFTCFKTSCETPGFAETVYETITQLKYSNVSPADIGREDFPPSIAPKMRDIALIYQTYEDFVRGRFADSGAKMQLLIDEIPKSGLIKNSTFYIKDFDYFTVQEALILRQLLIYSKGVVAAVTYGNAPRHERLHMNEAFNTLITLAKGLEADVQIEDAPDTFNEISRHIATNLFAEYGGVEELNAESALQIHCASNVFDETARAARYIKQKVAEGARFKDFLVVASDTAKYGFAAEQAFAVHDIPYFLDRKKCLRHHAAARFIMRAIDIKKRGFLVEDIVEFAKSGFYGAEPQTAFLLENLCLKRGMKRCPDMFTSANPEEREAIDKCNELIVGVTASLKPLKFDSRDKAENYISQIKKFAESMQIKEKTEAIADAQKEADLLESKFSAQVWEKLQGVLDNLAEIMGGAVITSERFVKLLESGLKAAKISVLPLYNDCVVVSELDKARAQAHKHLIVLGANDGLFPMVKKDAKLINDRNMDELASYGVQIYPKVRVENKRERFNVYQLLIEPRESVFVGYSATGDAENAMLPSVVVEELCKMCGCVPIVAASAYICGKRQARLLFTEGAGSFGDGRGDSAGLAQLGALYEALNEKRLTDYIYRKQPKENISGAENLMFPKKSVSVTKIETFLACPYKFFWQNGVRLKPRPAGELRSLEIGNLVHECAEKFVRGLPRSGETDAAATKRAASIFETITGRPEFAVFLSAGKSGFALKRLKEEIVSLCVKIKRQTEQSDFKPYAQELAFGFDEADSYVVRSSRGGLRLNGKIDRVDVSGDKFIVIDYKTGGEVKFSEKSLYTGEILQLPVYVKMFAQKSGLEPAGFYYLQLREKYEKEPCPLKFNGRTLADADVICAVDKTAVCGSSALLEIKQAQDGGLKLDDGKTVTKEQMRALLDYAEIMICGAAELIANGYIADAPRADACKYCDFHAMCGFEDLGRGQPRKNEADVSAGILTEIVQCQN